jgi:hypothetical protein
MQVLRCVAAFLIVIAGASVASAEVSDKAASIPQHWLLALPLAAILFLAASFRWWLGAVLAVVPVFILLGSIDMTFDKYIGPALWHEQGWPYFASLWGSDLLILGALASGVRRGWARRQVSRELPAG